MVETNEVEKTKKKNKRFLIQLLADATNRTDLIDKINTITKKDISFLCSSDITNPIYNDSFGTMYYHYVVIRKLIYVNNYFIKNMLFALAKIVHPNIQIFYGLMFDTQKNNNTDHDNENKDIEKVSHSNAYLILEYVNSINLTELSYLKQILSIREELLLKMQIIDRIAQTMVFLYHSNYPYLVLNGHTVKLNYNLLTDKHQHLKVIYCNSLYIGANLIKLTEIGTYNKYNKVYLHIYNVLDENSYDISYHSPELLAYLMNKEKKEALPDTCVLESWDVWSFGCIVFELFSGANPYSETLYKNDLINEIIKGDFAKENNKELKELKNNIDNSAGKELHDLINKCTLKNEESRPKFHDVVQEISEIIKTFTKENFTEEEIKTITEKVTNLDFKYYHMPKFEELNLLDQQIKLAKALHRKITQSESTIEELTNTVKALNK